MFIANIYYARSVLIEIVFLPVHFNNDSVSNTGLFNIDATLRFRILLLSFFQG